MRFATNWNLNLEMLRTLRLELRDLDTGRKALRSFGWLVGAVLLLIGGYVLWR